MSHLRFDVSDDLDFPILSPLIMEIKNDLKERELKGRSVDKGRASLDKDHTNCPETEGEMLLFLKAKLETLGECLKVQVQEKMQLVRRIEDLEC